MTIKVIDAMMGAGKTTAMLNYVNAAPMSQHFIFVTPFLTEGERINAYCPARHFQTPEAYDDPEHPGNAEPRSKLIDFKSFLRHQQNIVTTHALFERIDAEAAQLIADGNYTLIMDEVANVISKYEISPYDARILNRKCLVDAQGQLSWNPEESQYWGDFIHHKQMCDRGWLWRYNDSVLISLLPPHLFTIFHQVFIMTYMFHAQFQRGYFEMFHLPYEIWHVTGNSPDTYRITRKPTLYVPGDLKSLIHICQDKKLNAIGAGEYALSSGWYERNADGQNMKQLKNNVYNYFRHAMGCHVEDALWTSYRKKPELYEKNCKERPPYFVPKSYATDFLSCNARATNEYRTRTVCAYAINRFPTPEINNFLANWNIKIDRNAWALSEMLQWIWRSAIRDGKEIWLYIPSERMRNLLQDWIDEVTTEANEAA